MIAVTGAGGYLGSRLVQRWAPDRDVRALVRERRGYVDGVDQREVDLCGPVDAVADALAGATTVIHLAGENEVVAAQDPDGALTGTVVASRHVAAAAARVGARRLVYASTVHVYGDRLAPGAVVDEDAPPAPRSPYAVARLASEHLVRSVRSPDLDVVVLRLTNVVGAPVDIDVDRWTLVTNDLCREAVTRGTVTLRSSGTQHRDFVAIDDVERLFDATADGAVPDGTYNVGSGRCITVRALAEMVCDRVESMTGQRPQFVAPAVGDEADAPYRVDVDRLRALGIDARTPLEDAIDGIVALCLGGLGAEPHPQASGSRR